MYHIVYNPCSGKKKGKKNMKKVEKLLTEKGIAYRAYETAAKGGAKEVVRRITEEGGREIIVVGGDGTLHEALNGMVDPSVCTIGLIPSGTGNDFATKLGIPKNAKKALAQILKREAKPIDYFDVGGQRCMNVAGVGMDVDVLERCSRGKMKGKLKYFMSLLRSLFAYKGIPVTVERDGVTETHEVLLAVVCNGSQFGGGVRICPPAEVDDGQLDVLIVECLGGKWKIIKAFLKLLRGKLVHYYISTYFRCRSVKITPQVSCYGQIDGELYHRLVLDAELRTGLKFYY